MGGGAENSPQVLSRPEDDWEAHLIRGAWTTFVMVGQVGGGCLVLFLCSGRGWRDDRIGIFNPDFCFGNRLPSPRCFPRAVNFPPWTMIWEEKTPRPSAEGQAPLRGKGVATANLGAFPVTCDGNQGCFIVHVDKAFRK